VEDDGLIDPRAWAALVVQVCGSRVIARSFVTDFIDIWPERLDRLSAALEQADAEDAYVMLLSVRTSSEMVGAVALAEHAVRLEIAAHAGRLEPCAAGFAALRRVGDRTMAALAASLVE
jgi:hypothetical protein